MQATLLGLSTLIILALVAALVGPHFVDFNQYRAEFETEATRLTGVPLRVEGAIDVRLLPTPSLVLHHVEAGREGEEARVRVRELSVELALGPLLRGEWQASETRLVGPELRLALDAAGHVVWPISPAGLNPSQLSIHRLIIEDGHAVLDDAASVSRLVVDKFAFSGEVRSLLGPVKGEGTFAIEGQGYGFAISAGRLDAEGALKMHLTLNPTHPLLAIETEGTLRLASGTPEFDGTTTLTRPAGAVNATGHGVAFVPWHATGQIKAHAAGALIQALEYQYGPDEHAVKLTGSVNFTFGKTPRFDAVLAARQLDLDALLESSPASRQLPVAVVRKLVDTLAGPFKSPLPGKVGIGLDAVTLAGSLVQDVRGDIGFDANGWDVETVEFRAPGLTRVRASGRLASDLDGLTFKGPAVIEAADLKTLVSWLEAQPISTDAWQGILRASGEFTLGSDRVAVEGLRAEIDNKTIEGKLDYRLAADRAPARLNAELKAAQLNVDEVQSFAEAVLAGTKPEIPGEIALTLELGIATFAGVEAKNTRAKLSFDGNGLVLEQLAVHDLNGATLSASGRIEGLKSAPRGALSLDLDAHRLEGTLALISKLAPRVADVIGPVMPQLSPFKAKALLTMDSAVSGLDGTVSKLDVQASAGRVRLQLGAETHGKPWEKDALVLKLNAQASADEGSALVGLLGLDRVLTPDKGPGALTLAAQGPLNGELQTSGRLTAGGVLARVEGALQILGNGAHLGVELGAQAQDLGPGLRAAGVQSAAKLPATVTTRLAATPSKVQFENLAGTVGGVPLRGRMTLTLDPTLRIDGHLAADTGLAPAIFAALIGLPPPPKPGAASSTSAAASAGLSTEPFTPGSLSKIDGRIEFELGQTQFTPALVARNPRGVLRFGEGQIGLENLQADLAGGAIRADLSFQQTPEGLNTKGKLTLTNAELTTLSAAAERPFASGRLTLQVDAQGIGRSPATLVGSLSGIGTLALDGARLPRLNPKVFETAMRAVDQGLAIETSKIREVVGPTLEKGEVFIARGEGNLTVTSGRVRVINMVARGEGVDVAITGELDLSDWTVDGRLTLTGPAQGGNPRPDLFITLAGPINGATRTIDASALANWLMLRSLDREANRTEGVELEKRDPAGPADQKSPPPAIGAPTSTAPVGSGQSGVIRRKPGQAPEVAPTPPDPRSAPGLDRAPARPRRAAGEGASQTAPLGPPGTANPSILDRLFGSQR